MSQGNRRLAAIMFTDMVGYTALGQRDESLSLALLEENRKLLRPIFARHGGREIKTIGDAFLVEFPSALDAVRSAYDVQRASREFNFSLAPEKKIQLRVGVHLGDIVETKGDIFGDAVNIASRIEALAENGGVCLTQQVYDHVQNKFELPLVSIGRTILKNVATPLEVYKVVLPWEEGSTSDREAVDRRRLAALPLVNISPDRSDDYFAEGMTEELISTLSRIGAMKVISRTSVMRYKDTKKGIAEIARELNVGTILEGSVRKAGNRLRVTVQLIDTQTDEHLWSETYDREFQDVFAIQSDISQRVAEALQVRLLASDRERLSKVPTKNMEAYALYLKGRFFWNERTLQRLNKAVRYFEEAVKRDPGFALAYSGLADCYLILENWGFLRPKEALPKALEYAKKALEMDEFLAEAHTSLAALSGNLRWDWGSAEKEFRRAIELNPNYATARHWYAHGLLEPLKRWDEAVSEIREAERLDPLSLIIGTNHGDILLAQGRLEEAIGQYNRVVDTNPDFAYAHARLGLALILKSALVEGTAEIERARGLSPENTETRANLAYAYSVAGRTEDAEKMLQEMQELAKTNYVPAALFAEVYSVLGDADRAFEWLDRAADDRSSTLVMNLVEPHFDRIRSDPRFSRLVESMGLP